MITGRVSGTLLSMSLRVKFWGVRGSLPSSPTPTQWVRDIEEIFTGFFKVGYNKVEHIRPYLDSLPIPYAGGYGTATTCAQVRSKSCEIIIDCGSGIRNFSEEVMRGPAKNGQEEFHIFLTHFHWDHLIGLPFFAPMFIPGNSIHFYAVQPELESLIRGKFKRPYFPVPFEALRANIQFHTLAPRKPLALKDITVTPYQLDHPDPCWGFRVESGGKAYSHCVDTEGTRISPEALGPDLPLYTNADLMYFDAQYTLPELAEKANWGHSAAQLGLDIAFREQVKRVIFAHHDPGATTGQIAEIQRQTREYYEWRVRTADTNRIKIPNVKWEYAYEGLEVDL